jgi:hypothetical protein
VLDGQYLNVGKKIRSTILKAYDKVRSLSIFDCCRTPKPEEEKGVKQNTNSKLLLTQAVRGEGEVIKSGAEYIEMYGSEAGAAVDYFSTMAEELNTHCDKWAESYGGNALVFPDAI